MEALGVYKFILVEENKCMKPIITFKGKRCQGFERGLKKDIRTPISVVAKWTNFRN